MLAIPSFNDRASRLLTLTAMVLMCMSTGCSIDGFPITTTDSSVESSRSSVRQTDARGIALPFVTPFPDRWSTNSDGTSYEPCRTDRRGADQRRSRPHHRRRHRRREPPDSERVHLVLPWRTRCRLALTRHRQPPHVRARRKTVVGTRFRTISIKRRHVLVDSRSATACMTTVKSGKSPVFVRASKLFKPIGREAVCQRAIDFMKRVIDRMPPPES